MCSTAEQPIDIICIVEDPQGVKSIDFHVLDVIGHPLFDSINQAFHRCLGLDKV